MTTLADLAFHPVNCELCGDLFWTLDMPPYLCEQCADQEGT